MVYPSRLLTIYATFRKPSPLSTTANMKNAIVSVVVGILKPFAFHVRDAFVAFLFACCFYDRRENCAFP